MPNNWILNALEGATVKITDLAETVLHEDGNEGWVVDEIHLIPKDGNREDKVVCKKVEVNGKIKTICKRPEEW